MNNQPVGISDRFAGKVSHSQAMKKAKEEYRKYQKNTISPVEQADTFF